jgi:ankyrin repeat protein
VDFLQNGYTSADYERLRSELGDQEYFQFMYTCGISFGDIAVVQSALDNGVPVDLPNFGHGATALVWAVGVGEDLVRFLLERGADPKIEDWEGVSPLRNAISGRRPRIVRLLLEHGADPAERTRRGSALELATQLGAEGIIDLLRRTETNE